MSKFLYCCLLLIAPFQWASAQNDDINYDKFFHTSLGGGYGEFGGEIGDRLKNSLALGTSFGAGISKSSSIVLDFHYHYTDTDSLFSVAPGSIPKDRPDLFSVALGYNKILGDASRSHFHAQVGVGFAWLSYQDTGGSMKGFIPRLELGYALRIKSKAGGPGGGPVSYRRGGVRVFDVRTGSGLSHYTPVMVNKFVDFYVSCNYLNLNNPEGKGLMVFLGARYKKIVYSETYIPGENEF